MLIYVKEVGKGMHPSEAVVEIQGVQSTEHIVIDRKALIGKNQLDVGYPVGRQNGYYLVELPRETLQGEWRVWISKDQIADEALERTA